MSRLERGGFDSLEPCQIRLAMQAMQAMGAKAPVVLGVGWALWMGITNPTGLWCATATCPTVG
jgi:hypothetical protein